LIFFTLTPFSPLQIHNKVARMNNNDLRLALDYFEMQEDVSKLVRSVYYFNLPNLNITSLVRMPVYDCNFGWGR
jgi:hypothetical protein